ncbi:MAG: hypothetical protein IKY67_13780 [Paludibacteraceae bacterium]|nr:hypothetical protein [Paludibacteraceae bacterium]
MEMTQVYTLLNDTTKEVLGETAVVSEDLSNVVDVGDEIANLNLLDHYVASLVDHIGKMIFVNRSYSGTAPSVLMDSWEYGSILEKVTYDGLPEATENESWELEDGEEYNPNIFTQPKVSAKFFDKRVTFEVPMSFAERQVKSAFSSASQLNAFFSMIYNAIEKSMTVKTDSLIERTVNNFIAETLYSGANTVRSVNLLSAYNTLYDTELEAANAIYDPGFVRYACYIIKLYSDRMVKISNLFNGGGKDRFTPKDKQKILMLSEFKTAADIYLQSDTFHNEFTKLPDADEVAYWQGSGLAYDFGSTSAIKVKTSEGNTVSQAGILCTIFDRDALGVSNLNKRVTTDWNAKGEFWNNWYKFDAGYFNDFNENGVVFHLGEYSPTPAPVPPVSVTKAINTDAKRKAQKNQPLHIS